MNFPVSFISRTAALMGEENCKALCEAMQNDTPVGAKTGLVPEDAKLIPWTTDGYYLSARPTFTFDPLFHAGSYYVQEASSMFLESALRQYVESPVIALDLCAAPGGKSNPTPLHPPRRKSAHSQRSDAKPLADTCREHSKMGKS